MAILSESLGPDETFLNLCSVAKLKQADKVSSGVSLSPDDTFCRCVSEQAWPLPAELALEPTAVLAKFGGNYSWPFSSRTLRSSRTCSIKAVSICLSLFSTMIP